MKLDVHIPSADALIELAEALGDDVIAERLMEAFTDPDPKVHLQYGYCDELDHRTHATYALMHIAAVIEVRRRFLNARKLRVVELPPGAVRRDSRGSGVEDVGGRDDLTPRQAHHRRGQRPVRWLR